MLHTLQTQFPVHLPVREEYDVGEEGRQLRPAELLVRVQQSLAGHAVTQNEDDQEEEEGGDLGDHPMEYHKLRAQAHTVQT